MADNDSIHEQLTTISGKLGRVQGITEGIAAKVSEINGRIGYIDQRLEKHISDDSKMFAKVFSKLSMWRGGAAVLVVLLGALAGLFSGWFVR